MQMGRTSSVVLGPRRNGLAIAHGTGGVPLRAFGNKAGVIGGNNAAGVLGDATHQSATSRVLCRAPGSGRITRLAFQNWRMSPAGEVNGANAITVKASIEIAGVTYPLSFSGSRSITIASGDTVYSDDTSIYVPVGTVYYIRTYVSVATLGMTWPIGRACSNANGEGSNYNASVGAGTDVVDTAGALAGTGTSGYVYSASGVFGYADDRTIPVVSFFGDSIVAGAGEIGAGVFGDANGYTGFIERALGHSVHWISCTRSSDTTVNFNASTKRLPILQDRVTHSISEYGSNDIYGGGLPLAAVQANAITAWGRMPGKRWQTTITPRTTSTDGFTTPDNQTIVGAGTNNSVRTNFNDWLRDGAPMSAGVAVAIGTVGALRAGEAGHPLTGVFDTADAAETARNSGLWKSTGGAWVTDGIHPVVLGAQGLAPSIILASLT